MWPLLLKLNVVNYLSFAIFTVVGAVITDEEYALMPPVFHLDNYDHCMLLGKEALYCRVTIDLSPENPANTSKAWNAIQVISRDVKNYNHSYLRHGICIKESCPEILQNGSANFSSLNGLSENISKCYTNRYKDRGLTATVGTIECMTEIPTFELNTYEIVVFTLMLIQICLVVLGTFYEGIAKYKPKSEYQECTQSSKLGKFISCFSLRKNWDRIVNTQNSEALQSIEGIRCVCTTFIICCHSCIYQIVGGVLNTRHAEEIFHQPVNMLMINIFVCQPFFLMSSWLLAYYFLKIFENERLCISHIVKYLVNRYIRLMPSFIALFLLATGSYRFFQSGPNYNFIVDREIESCKENWWTNVILINNYYGVDKPCLFHTWYLAADTQLYILALIILTITRMFKRYTKEILGISFILATLTPAILSYVNDHDIVIRLFPENLFTLLVKDDVYNNIHIPGHTNSGASVLGLIFGYVYYKYNGTKLFKTRVQVAIWYAVVLVPIIMMTPLPIAFFSESYVNIRILTAIHAGLARNCFAFCIGLLILGISQGHGWFLRDALNWAPFQVLGKLCFCTYLVHPVIQIYRISQTRTPAYMDVLPMFLHATDDIGAAFAVGCILCLFVEMPFWSLQKAYIPQVKAKSKAKLPHNEDNGDINKIHITTNQEVIRL